jgi:CHASE2 domain-containing sensor protein
MDMHTIVFAVLCLALLVGGAGLLVRGASRLAAAVGVTPPVIGLTVAAAGAFSAAMVSGVIPLAFVTLLVFPMRAMKRQGSRADTR